jgi:hypothetical protein
MFSKLHISSELFKCYLLMFQIATSHLKIYVPITCSEFLWPVYKYENRQIYDLCCRKVVDCF